MVDTSESGVDSRRATADGDWNRTFTLVNGLRPAAVRLRPVRPLQCRHLTPDQAAQTSGRAQATAGVDLSWPLIRQTQSSTIILEPLMEGAISPKASANPKIPNGDSIDFVFDETQSVRSQPLSRLRRLRQRRPPEPRRPGDRRLGRWPRGACLRGPQLPVQRGPDHPGLQRLFRHGFGLDFRGFRRSVPGAVAVRPHRGGRRQLRPSTPRARRQLRPALRARLCALPARLHQSTGPLHAVEGSADVMITKRWGIVAYGQRDLQQGVWARRDIGVVLSGRMRAG